MKNAKGLPIIYQVYSNNAADDSTIRNDISAMHSDDAGGNNNTASYNTTGGFATHTTTDAAATTTTTATVISGLSADNKTHNTEADYYGFGITCSDSTVLSNNYSAASSTCSSTANDTHQGSTQTNRHDDAQSEDGEEPLVLASSSLSSNNPIWIESVDHCLLGNCCRRSSSRGGDNDTDNDTGSCCSCFREKTWKVEKLICITSSLLFLLASIALVAYFGCQHVIHHDYYYDDYNNNNNDDDSGNQTTERFRKDKIVCFVMAYTWFILHVVLEFFLDTGIQKRYMEHMRYNRAEAAAATTTETDLMSTEDDNNNVSLQERFSPELSHLNLAQSTLFGIAILSQATSIFLVDQDLLGLFLKDNNNNDDEAQADDDVYYASSSSSSSSNSTMAAWTSTITTASRWLLFVAAVFYFLSAAMTMASRGCCGFYCLTRARVLEHQHRRHACIVIFDVLANALYVTSSAVLLTVSMSFDIIDVSNTNVQFHVQDYYQDYNNNHHQQDDNANNDNQQQHHYYHGKIAFLEIIAIVWVVMGFFYCLADLGRCCFYEDKEVEGLIIGRTDSYFYEMAAKGSSSSSTTTCGSGSTNNETVGISSVETKLKRRVAKLFSNKKQDGQLQSSSLVPNGNSVDDATGILERDGYYSPLMDTTSNDGGASMVELIRPPSSRPLKQPLVIVTTTMQHQQQQQHQQRSEQQLEEEEEKSQPYQPPQETPMRSMSPLLQPSHLPPPRPLAGRSLSSIVAVETSLPDTAAGSTFSPVEDVVIMSSEGPVARCLSQPEQPQQQQQEQVGKAILEPHHWKPAWLSTTMSGPRQEKVNQQKIDPQQQLLRRDNMCPIPPPAVTRRDRLAPTLLSAPAASSSPMVPPLVSPRVHEPMRSSKHSAASAVSESSSRNPICNAIAPPAVKRRETQLQLQAKQNQQQAQSQSQQKLEQQQQDDLTRIPPSASELHNTADDSKYDAPVSAATMRRWRSSPDTTGEQKRNRVAELLQMSDDDNDDNNNNNTNNRTRAASATSTPRRIPPRPLIMSVNTGTGRTTTTTPTTPVVVAPTPKRSSRVAIPLPATAATAASVSSQHTTTSKKKMAAWASLKKYRKYTS